MSIIFLYLSVYQAFYIISSILLAVTICVYTHYRKLLNDYTRLMRQYSLQLIMAFMLMSVNKSMHFGAEIGMMACQLSGKIKPYFQYIILYFTRYVYLGAIYVLFL